MRAGEKVLAEKIREEERLYKKADPYVIVFWSSIVCMLIAMLIGIGMLFV